MKKILICMFFILILSVNTFAESFNIPTAFIGLTKIKTKNISSSFNEEIELVYDDTTKIIYLFYTGLNGNKVITNYYSANGKLCKYDEINKKLVEVE